MTFMTDFLLCGVTHYNDDDVYYTYYITYANIITFITFITIESGEDRGGYAQKHFICHICHTQHYWILYYYYKMKWKPLYITFTTTESIVSSNDRSNM